MKKTIGVLFASVAVLGTFLAGSVSVAAATSSVPDEKASVFMVILAMVLAGLLIALVVIRIMAAKMNTVRKQDSAKGYGQKLILTEKSDAFLYSRTTSRHVNN